MKPEDIDDAEHLGDIEEGRVEQEHAKEKATKAKALAFLLYTLMGVTGAFLIYEGYRMEDGSFWQGLAFESGIALLTVLGFVFVLPWYERFPRHVWSCGIILLAFSGFQASISTGPSKALLSSVAVSIAFILIIDFVIERKMEQLRQEELAARQRIDEASRKVANAESILDYKYAVHDMLGMPRPDKIGGMKLPPGASFGDVLGFGSLAAAEDEEARED